MMIYQRGLTLLELMLVVTILSAVSFMALTQVTDDVSQVRYEDTKNRLNAIKHAIVGDTSRTINGQPELRGFVVDMGRLPNNIQELIDREYCDDPRELTEVDCTASGGVWTSLPPYEFDDDVLLWTGWNGPYLTASAGEDFNHYIDGWGNTGISNNFGWIYTLADYDALVDSDGDGVLDNDLDLVVQSTGQDGIAGNLYGEDYGEDYPPNAAPAMLRSGEYQMVITTNAGNGGVDLDFGEVPACWLCDGGDNTNSDGVDGIDDSRADCEGTWYPDSAYLSNGACSAAVSGSITGYVFGTANDTLCLRVWRRVDGDFDTDNDADVDTDDAITSDSTVPNTVVWDGSRKIETFKLSAAGTTTLLPQGNVRVDLYQYDTATLTCTTSKFFATQSAQSMSIIPGTRLSSIKWPVQ